LLEIKAFKWILEFLDILEMAGFDVVIGKSPICADYKT